MPGMDAVTRFSGFAELYDDVRPSPPEELVDVLIQWARVDRPSVVDVGAGTGLSAAMWLDRAERLVAIEPSADMRAIAQRRLAGASVLDGTAETTGLPERCADIVTASQAMHWFDASRALPEIARILRPGGVFAAYDADWPPTVDWEVERSYLAFDEAADRLEVARGIRPPHAEKASHARRMRESGLFRHVAEIALHKRDSGDAERMVGLARSQGGTVGLLAAGATEAEIGLDRLREVAARRIPRPVPWWWTYRVRLAVP